MAIDGIRWQLKPIFQPSNDIVNGCKEIDKYIWSSTKVGNFGGAMPP